MTWTAKIVSKDYQKGILQVGIEFTNEIETFSESLDMTGGVYELLERRVQARLDTLNQTEKFSTEISQAVDQKRPIEPRPTSLPSEETPT